jgi:predicted acetyltransferase
MFVELRELSLDDGMDVLEMIREIGPGEGGFVNSGHDIQYEDFAEYLQGHANMALGTGIDLSRLVPQTMYWLLVDGAPVGIGKVRDYLNDHLKKIGGHIGYTIRPSERGKGYGNLILKELLKKAKEKGIEAALLTCGEGNVRSRKVIEHNGGELDGITEGECRYWIHLT